MMICEDCAAAIRGDRPIPDPTRQITWGFEVGCEVCGRTDVSVTRRDHLGVTFYEICRAVLARAARYIDYQGRELFICSGISCMRAWTTYYRKPSGSLKRVTSPCLPIRENPKQAQDDLDLWAQRGGLQRKPSDADTQ
ncbi:MAG: hypothetical protein A2V88_13995 [Elusimicrobia bacterium RBG_16_66_12]|nr:MAG: hypothetical protein A2V88_13995 [Elusimicrobia bacterium RBG_16_66_12]